MNGDAASPTGRRILPLALLLLVVHVAALSGFVVDDAFISWRYSRNIAAALGPVYNAGERVEGFSNPLYTWLLAVPARFLTSPGALPAIGRLTGVMAALGSILLLSRLPLPGGSTGPALALLLTGTSTSLALWAVGGLETTLYGFLLMAGLGLTVSRPRGRARSGLTGLTLAAITLSRPEGIVPAMALYAVRFVDPDTKRAGRDHLATGLAFLAPVAAAVIFRLAWYGDLWPNTWYAKKPTLAESWRKGSWYIVSFIHHNGGRWLYAAAPLALLDRARRRAVLVSGLVLLAYLPYVVYVGGDWMDHHRFLAPVIPLIYLWVGAGWGVVVEAGARRLTRWPGGVVAKASAPLAVLAVWLLLLRPTIDLTRDERRSGGYVSSRPYYETVGRLVGAVSLPGWSVATHDIGAIGWYGGTRIIDLLGLVDHDLARNIVTADSLVARRRPEMIVLHYDNRPAPTGRWRAIDLPGFDTLYVAPRAASLKVPGSIRVRCDVVPQVEERLRSLSPPLIEELERLDRWLVTRQPDGLPWRGGNPPDDSAP